MTYKRTQETIDKLKASLNMYQKTKRARNKTLYSCWWNIKARCYRVNHKYFASYGGRGIKMCDEWLNDYWAFEAWCLKNGWAKGLQIDRIDNNGNYEPSNCRWVDRHTNMLNTRNAKKYDNDERTPVSKWEIRRAIKIEERAKAKAEKWEKRKIVQIDPTTNAIVAEFRTYLEAAVAVGTTKSNISNAIHRCGKCKGYYWRPKYQSLK